MFRLYQGDYSTGSAEAFLFFWCFARRQGISLDEALGFFYHSEVYKLVCDGVSDMHCMSDVYLADELEQEYAEKADSNLEPSNNSDSESIVVDGVSR